MLWFVKVPRTCSKAQFRQPSGGRDHNKALALAEQKLRHLDFREPADRDGQVLEQRDARAQTQVVDAFRRCVLIIRTRRRPTSARL